VWKLKIINLNIVEETSWKKTDTLEEETITSKDYLVKVLHRTIKKVSEDIDSLKFNTAISSMMIFVNEMGEYDMFLSKDIYESFLKILSPFAPHLAEELWSSLGYKKSIFKDKWPDYDKKLIIDEEVTIAIQINGKLRGTIKVERGISEEDLKSKIIKLPKINGYINSQRIKKFIYIKDKLVNIVLE
jgi:leucyl-tRNA synthetase